MAVLAVACGVVTSLSLYEPLRVGSNLETLDLNISCTASVTFVLY